MKQLRAGQGRDRSGELTEPRRLLLYVEDDEVNRHVASARLEKKYEVVFAVSDREACQALRQLGPRLSLVLMDIELQGSRLNGIELTQLIRGQLDPVKIPDFAAGVPRLDIPILFVTANGDVHRREALIAAGADEVIQKPVDFVALNAAIARKYLRRVG